MRQRLGRRRICRLAGLRIRATGIANREKRRWIFIASGRRFTLTTATACSARKSTTRSNIFRLLRRLIPRLDCLISRARLNVDPGALSLTWAAPFKTEKNKTPAKEKKKQIPQVVRQK